jgi:hypothetical protein
VLRNLNNEFSDFGASFVRYVLLPSWAAKASTCVPLALFLLRESEAGPLYSYSSTRTHTAGIDIILTLTFRRQVHQIAGAPCSPPFSWNCKEGAESPFP